MSGNKTGKHDLKCVLTARVNARYAA